MWWVIAAVALGALIWLTLEGMKVDPAQRRLREDAFQDAFIRRPTTDVHALVEGALDYVRRHGDVADENKLARLLADEIELRLEAYRRVLYRHMVDAWRKHGNDWRRFSIVSVDGRLLAQITRETDEQFSRGEETVEALRTLTKQLTRKKIAEVRHGLEVLEGAMG